MKKINNLLSFAIITIGLILLAIPLSLPIEGGYFLIISAILWFGVQLWRHTSFSISKAFVFFFLLIIYLFVFSQFSRTIPITHILVHKSLILLILALLSYTSLRTDSDRIPWENAMIALAIIVSIWSVIEIFDWYRRYIPTLSALQVLGDLQISYRLRGSLFGHPNPLAGFLNFVWPIAFIRLYQSKKTLHKFLWGALLLFFAITIIYTNSRGALLGTFGGLLIILIIYILGNIYKNRTSNTKLNKKTIAIILSSLGFIFVLTIGILWRAQFTGQLINRSFSGRGTIWQFSWEAFLESPLFGQGIAAFPISYTKLAQLPPGDFAPSAHNLWLQASVDYGIMGLAFVCVLMLIFTYFGGKKIWAELPNQPQFYVAYLAGGIAFLLQQTIDFMLVTTSYLVSFMLVLVLMSRYSLQIGEWELNRKKFLLVGTFLISLLIGYQFSINAKTMSARERTSLSSMTKDNRQNLSLQICDYSDKLPENTLYKFECSLAVSHQMITNQQDEGVIQDMLDQSIHYQLSGYELNPYWMTQQANLSVLYWMNSENQSALEHMKGAATAAPMYDLFWFNYGWMEEQMGNRAASIDAYTRALRINPIINRSSFIQDSSYFSEAAEDLEAWLETEELWNDWYGKDRHDRTKYQFDFWRGIIALSVDQIELAVSSFETELEKGTKHPTLFAHLAYAYELNGQTDLAYQLAQDFALLYNNRIKHTKNSVELSMVASILRKNGDLDTAYDLLLDAYQYEKERITYIRYYVQIYNQQILLSDISPWLIRSQLILIDTQDDWHWLAEETLRRGDVQLSEDISFWLDQSSGIATLIQK